MKVVHVIAEVIEPGDVIDGNPAVAVTIAVPPVLGMWMSSSSLVR